MLKIEDFKCDNCDGAGKSPYEMYRCKECDGEGYSDYKILTLIRTESLDTVLAGIEIVKAMKEEKAIVNMGTEDPLKFIKSTDEFYIAGTGAYISPLEGIHALLENWESTQ